MAVTGTLTKVEALTDLEAYVDAEGRAELVKQVRAKINELGIQYIYYQFVSVTGRIVGKGVPAEHWEAIAQNGFQLVYGATANLALDRHRNYIGYGPEASELVAIPDLKRFVNYRGISVSHEFFVRVFVTAKNQAILALCLTLLFNR